MAASLSNIDSIVAEHQVHVMRAGIQRVLGDVIFQRPNQHPLNHRWLDERWIGLVASQLGDLAVTHLAVVNREVTDLPRKLVTGPERIGRRLRPDVGTNGQLVRICRDSLGEAQIPVTH